MNNWLADHGSAIGLTRSDVEDWQKACGKALSEAQFVALFQKLLGYCEIPAHFTEPKESGEEMAALASACDQSQLASRVLLARLLVWLELTLKRAICWRPPGAEPGRDYEATEPTFLWCAFRVAGLSERDLASTHEAAKLRAIRWLISDVLMQKSEGWAPSSDEMFTNFAGLIGADPTIPEDLKPQVDRVKMFWFIDNAAELPSTECDVLLNKGEVCYWKSEAIWREEATVSQGRSYAGIGTSVKLISGISLRSGYFEPIARNVIHYLKPVIGGGLYITNKRVIVVSEGVGAKSLSWRTVLDIWPTDNGFMLVKSSGKSPVLEIKYEPELTLRIAIAAAKRSAR